MPEFEIKSPDGRTFQVTGPEGSTAEQALERVKAQHAEPSSSLGSVTKQIPYGLAEGAIEGVSLAHDVASGNLLKRTEQSFAGAAPGKVPQQRDPTLGEQIHEKLPDWANPKKNLPQTGLEKAVRGPSEVLGNPFTWGGPGTRALKAGMGVMTGLGSEAAAGIAGEKEYGTSPARLVGGVAAPVSAGGLVGAVRGAISPQANVAADLARAIQRDGTTPDQLMASLQRARNSGHNATLADVGGENIRGIVERIAQTPGAGRTTVQPTLTARQQQQMGRLTQDLATLTGSQRTATQALERTMAERSAAADPLYDAAYNFNARAVPEIEQAWQRVTSTGWGEQLLNSPDFRRTLQTEYGIANPQDAPLMRVIDAWKKEADGLVGEAVRGGNNNRARVIGNMRDELVALVDQHNPAYAEARNAWSGPSRYLDAITEGRTIMSPQVSAEELTARLAGLTEAEREAYRIGAVSAIRGKMGSDPARMPDMTKYLRSPEMRGKLAALMPTAEAAESWGNRMNFEVGSSELTGRALSGSATARRLAEQADADGIVGDLVMGALAHGPSMGMLRQILTWAPNRVRDTLRSRSNQLLAEVLVTPQGAQRIGPALQGPPPAPRGFDSAATAARSLAGNPLTSPLAAGGP